MNYASLCSGIEAASAAWHPFGWRSVFFSENAAFPGAVLAHHYPDTPNYGDMTNFREWPDAEIDVLVGGTPCQPFSIAGLRKGMDDPRGNLALTFLAIADRYEPPVVLWENVPGVLSSNGGRDFGSFLGGLAEIGYGFAYRILDAQFFGVPQRRRRVFVVGHRGGWRRAASILFDRESLSGNPAPCRKAGQEVAGTFTSRTTGGSWNCDVDLAASGYMQPVAGTVTSRAGRNGGASNQDVDGGSLVVMAHGQGGAEISETSCPTLSCNHEAPIAFDSRQEMRVRRLTPVECARLQGFPDDYLDIEFNGRPASDTNKYRVLGNSMAVPVMAWLGSRIDMGIRYSQMEKTP